VEVGLDPAVDRLPFVGERRG